MKDNLIDKDFFNSRTVFAHSGELATILICQRLSFVRCFRARFLAWACAVLDSVHLPLPLAFLMVVSFFATLGFVTC
jgi:hypothetical protein